MTLEIKFYRKGYRLYCKMTGKYFGPTWINLEKLDSFLSWYDGDPRFIETILEPKTWDIILQEWFLACTPSK